MYTDMTTYYVYIYYSTIMLSIKSTNSASAVHSIYSTAGITSSSIFSSCCSCNRSNALTSGFVKNYLILHSSSPLLAKPELL